MQKFPVLLLVALFSSWNAHAENTSLVLDEDLGLSVSAVEVPVAVGDDSDLFMTEMESNGDLKNFKGSPVKETQLTLFGRGTYNPKNNESLVIACVGELEGQGSLKRKCDELQFVLFDTQKNATWYSVPFYFGSQKKFTKKMKNLEKYARPGSIIASNPRDIIGCLLTFGGAGFLVATVSTGVGVAFFGVAVLVAAQSGKGWRALDFLSPLPNFVIDTSQERPFLATADQNGWSWSSNPVKMRAKKFERLKDLLSRHDEVLR
jgi:hypothetical protein